MREDTAATRDQSCYDYQVWYGLYWKSVVPVSGLSQDNEPDFDLLSVHLVLYNARFDL